MNRWKIAHEAMYSKYNFGFTTGCFTRANWERRNVLPALL